MPRLSNAELEQRIALLEAENAALRDAAQPPALPEPIAPQTSSPARGRSWAWALLSAVLVLIGIVLAPVAIVATWVRADLTDTDRFVSTFAPLARDADVRAFVTDQTMAVVDDTVDIEQLTSDLVDGITSLGTPPRATDALNAIKGPAAAGIRSLLESRIAAFVQSEAFADVWSTALRVSHRQLVAAMTNDPDAAVRLGGDGTIGVQLGPIIDAVKAALVDQGIGFASRIPTVDRTITVAQSDSLPAVQLYYGVAVGAGVWLPWVALAFLAAGVLVARRRATALIATAVVLGVVMAAMLAAIAVGQALFITSVSPTLLPSGVADELFERVAGGMRDTAVAVLTLGIVVAVVGWLTGPFAAPRRLRAVARSLCAQLRGFGEARNVTTGRVGEWVYRQRTLLRAAVAVVAALVVVVSRPLTPGLIVGTLVAAGLVVAALELVQRPPAEVAAEEYDQAVAAG